MEIGLRINECIYKFNEGLLEGEKKMTQVKLAQLTMPEKRIENSKYQINQLALGKSDNIRLSVLKKIRDELKTNYESLIR